jgi:bifunctional polynucleotide phosphatase/kinase
MSTLNIPLFIAIAFEKEHYKPNTILFDSLTTNKKFINKQNSFFVGDALGRKDDFSDSDKVFAENIGIQWIAPETFFIEQIDKNSISIPELPLSEDNEVVIMMGYPGSGKSTIANNICTKYPNYICIQGDIYKTSKAMIKKASEYVKQKSIIFDATNSSKTKRKEYIDFAKKYGYNIKCIHVKTPLENAYQRNKMRESDKQVPRIAYSVYTKHYEPPTEEEGFILLEV